MRDMRTKDNSKKRKKRVFPKDRANVWFAQARYDLDAALLSLENKFNEWACFQAEQAAEKALKSMIVKTGERAPRIHKLSALIGVVKKYVPSLKGTYIQASTLQAFTFVSRYPFLLPGQYNAPHEYITAVEAKQCIEEATAILEIANKSSKE